MNKYFGIPIEFDRAIIESSIKEQALTGKGYVCFVDSNVLAMVKNQEPGLEEALNHSLLNSCDGSYIAMFASRIHRANFKAYNGPELFKKFIHFPDVQCIIGNKEEVFDKVKSKVITAGGDGKNLHYIPLPYEDVDNFDYKLIADGINAIKPGFIWISLGAPKQELFMYRMLPHLNGGVMLGVGAALNYFSGEIKDIPKWAIKCRLIWFYRILTEPKKQIQRSWTILTSYPGIYQSEKKANENIDSRRTRIRGHQPDKNA